LKTFLSGCECYSLAGESYTSALPNPNWTSGATSRRGKRGSEREEKGKKAEAVEENTLLRSEFVVTAYIPTASPSAHP